MNRRRFLTLALAGCTLGVVGCGRQSPAEAVEPAQVAPAAAAGPVLAAPPLAANTNPINEVPARFPNRLEIPAIHVDVPVVELGWTQGVQEGQVFSQWEVAAYAAGWHKNSAVPGQGGNIVMSGHNNILGAVFRELDQLKKGDPIEAWMGNHVFDYAVEQVIVLPDTGISDEQRSANNSWIGPFDDERLTLVSCWPRNNNTHRIVVIAHPELAAQATGS
jgi:sortase A